VAIESSANDPIRTSIPVSIGPLNTEVKLRDVAERDLSVLFEHQRQPDANQMAAFPARDRDSFMEHWSRILADQSIIKRAIVFEGELAGNIVSFEQAGERQIGYWIGQEFWGKGIATEALRLFLATVRERPLYAHVAKQNIGSIRVLEKCGFTLSGENNVNDSPYGAEVEEFTFELEE